MAIAGVPAPGTLVYITNRAVDHAGPRSLADLYDDRWGVKAAYPVKKDTGP